jgi:hypothetical protein
MTLDQATLYSVIIELGRTGDTNELFFSLCETFFSLAKDGIRPLFSDLTAACVARAGG